MGIDVSMIIENKKLKASITVEAAFSFTITVFVLFLMLGPLLIIKTTSDFLVELNSMSKIRCDYEMFKYASKDTELYKKVQEYLDDRGIDEKSIENVEDIVNNAAFAVDFINRYGEDDREYRNIDFIYSMNPKIYDEETHIVKYD